MLSPRPVFFVHYSGISPATAEAVGQWGGKPGMAHLLLGRGYVVPHPPERQRTRVAVIDNVAGPGIAVPGLADGSGVHYPALLPQIERLPFP